MHSPRIAWHVCVHSKPFFAERVKIIDPIVSNADYSETPASFFFRCRSSQVRIGKAEEIREAAGNPYAYRYERKTYPPGRCVWDRVVLFHCVGSVL